MRGVQNMLIPSFTPDLAALDEDGIRWDVRQSIAHGFFGMNLTTQAGLTFDEAQRFVSVAVAEAAGQIQVSPVVTFNSLDENLAFIRHAAAAGCDSVLVAYPPSFYPQSPDDILAVTRQMCAAAPALPMVLYVSFKWNFGRFHPSGFPLDVLEALTDIPNVVGLLVGIIEPGFVHEAFRRFGDKVLVQAPWERWAPLLTQNFGMQYFGPGAYELFQTPEQRYLVDYYNLLLDGRTDEAMAVYWRLTPVRLAFEKQFMPTQMIGTYHWPQQKFYQWLTGGNGGFTRQPVMKMYQHEMDEVMAALPAIGITPRDNLDEFYVGRANYEKGLRPKSTL
jgi:4-hydroxy-tetrahydrodipicolinate synthase